MADGKMTRRGFIAAAGGAVAAVALAGCSQGQQASASGSGASNAGDGTGLYFTHQDVRASPEWVAKLAETAAKDADQLIVVAGVGKTCAYITMHEKDDAGAWNQIIATPGFIGKDGLGDANIEDAYTPVGAFTIDKAFGLEADPGCAMEYTQVDDTYYWSGDAREGMHFNELVTTNDLPDLDTDECEHITDFDYAYRYVLNMGYNAECEVRKGFGFFLHSFRVNRPYTGGCVAVPEDIMRFIMQHVKPGARIAIGSLEEFCGDLDA